MESVQPDKFTAQLLPKPSSFIFYQMVLTMRLATFSLLLLMAVLVSVNGKSVPKYQKKHFHYQKLYSSPSKPTYVKPSKVYTYSKKGYVPVQYTTHVPVFQYGYKVHDPQNNNFQEKTEQRIGDAVEGYYSLLEPNGEVRVVRYQSDDSGFHSKVTVHKHNSRPKARRERVNHPHERS